jgi:hypothetical protein
LDAENAAYRLADKPTYIPGGPGFFAKTGVKGLPSQDKDNFDVGPLSVLQKQMNIEVSTPGAS